MKIKVLLASLSCIFFLFNVYSQEQLDVEPSYMNIKTIRSIQQNQNQKIDSLGYKIVGVDTLIKVKTKQAFIPKEKKIKVPYVYKDSTFLDIYKNVVYRTHLVEKNNRWVMKLWKDTIRIYFNNAVPKSHKKNLMKMASKLSKKVDSLNIIQVDDISKSNYLIYYMDKNESFDYELAINNQKAGYYVKCQGPFINVGRLKVNTLKTQGQLENLALLKYCFFQSLGNFSYSDKLEPKSYLSASQEVRKLTKMDLEILEYHYSYGIGKGTNLEDFDKQNEAMKYALDANPNAEIFIEYDTNINLYK